ncbi:exosortase [candidate division GN15 bacterium]|uniref:Exosortase n=1 Tax=candidate division GN15 bacterium TaxID=2072418 RepID=A0A855XDF6_9BACT|nr:MAG: exosortase [candidate division GN15 bacterium]
MVGRLVCSCYYSLLGRDCSPARREDVSVSASDLLDYPYRPRLGISFRVGSERGRARSLFQKVSDGGLPRISRELTLVAFSSRLADTNCMNQTDTRQRLIQHLTVHRYYYLLLAALTLLSVPVLKNLIADWIRDDNYSHGFFIIPISIYLIYRRRHDLAFPAAPSRAGMAVFIAGCLGLILGIAASEFFTTRLSLVVIITGMSLYYLGRANFRKVWFAFFFLLFMIPIPAVVYNAATFPMQLFATKVTAGLLQLIGVPCVRHGNVIQLPDYALEVLEACSGLRSLVTLMALAALYAYLTLPGTVRPIILFLAAIPVAVVTNIFRIFVTAIAAYAISTSFAEDFLHEISGLLVFVTALVLILILGGILRWRKRPS